MLSTAYIQPETRLSHLPTCLKHPLPRNGPAFRVRVPTSSGSPCKERGESQSRGAATAEAAVAFPEQTSAWGNFQT